MGTPLTLQAVAEIVGGSVEGDGSRTVRGLAPLATAEAEDLTFADARRVKELARTSAGAAIVARDAEAPAPADRVRVDDVEEAIFLLLTHLAGPPRRPADGVHPRATVAETARLGEGVAVAAGAVIDERAEIGEGTVICANAVVGADVRIGRRCRLDAGAVVADGCAVGDRVRIGPNSVVGHVGFGYRTVDGVHHPVPHAGNVEIADDVEIGACTCVDRAKFGSTRIERGVKIDNLVQIAHNCRVGAGSVIAGQAALAGSVTLGRYVVIAGAVGVRDNVTIGDGAVVGAYAAPINDLPGGQQYWGVPAIPAREMFRVVHAWRRLPDLLKRVKKMESRLEDLGSPDDD